MFTQINNNARDYEIRALAENFLNLGKLMEVEGVHAETTDRSGVLRTS